MANTSSIKRLLGQIPFTADLYDMMRKGRPNTRYNLEQLAVHLPAAVEQVRPFAEEATKGKKLLLFATLHYWVEQAAIIGLALRGMGYDVTIAYLPYSDWRKELNPFDLRRQDLYTKRVLVSMDGLVKFVSLLETRKAAFLPDELEKAVKTASAFDTMYTLQVEDFDRESELYRLRLRMNRSAALTAMALLQDQRPGAVLVPNGLVTELGVFYQVARYLDLQTVTYEFNDQREQIWLVQNGIVMHQDTDALWAVRGKTPLTKGEREKIAALEDARMSAKKYGKGTRFWQDVASVGGEQMRKELRLDDRPIFLLTTNVLGDSLTLGRNTFAKSMAAWITETVRFLGGKPEIQLVIRVHPGERLTHGRSMVDVVKEALPSIPEHIHVIGPMEKVNTYDLMEVASLGLVYTTTTGMEMSMNGIPVVVCGETHYRKRGFTRDPQDWGEYYDMLETAIQKPERLTQEQVETAWNYAYRFFFDFPMSFPWRLMHFWKDVDIWPLERVLSDEGQVEYKKTFDYLAGEPIKW